LQCSRGRFRPGHARANEQCLKSMFTARVIWNRINSTNAVYPRVNVSAARSRCQGTNLIKTVPFRLLHLHCICGSAAGMQLPVPLPSRCSRDAASDWSDNINMAGRCSPTGWPVTQSMRCLTHCSCGDFASDVSAVPSNRQRARAWPAYHRNLQIPGAVKVARTFVALSRKFSGSCTLGCPSLRHALAARPDMAGCFQAVSPRPARCDERAVRNQVHTCTSTPQMMKWPPAMCMYRLR
jgi:hypothetical protein